MSKKFLSARKLFDWTLLVFLKVSDTKKQCKIWVSRFFFNFIFVWLYQNISWETPFLFLKFFDIEKRFAITEGITIFRRQCFVSQHRKVSKTWFLGFCEYLPLLGIDCPRMLWIIMLGEKMSGKGRKCVVILEKIVQILIVIIIIVIIKIIEIIIIIIIVIIIIINIIIIIIIIIL